MNEMLKLLAVLVFMCLGGASAQVTCGSQQYVPNPLNCSTYYECSNGVPYLMPCPTGQYFSPTKLVCEDGVDAGCKEPVTVVPTTSSQIPTYYCPRVDGSGSYLYPNPLSCSSFYMCHGGSLELFPCPQGLEYSVTERVCVYASIAKCDLNNLPSFPYGPTTPATCQGTTPQPATTSPPGPTPNYYCPEVDGATSYIYASPYSCYSYYMCSQGKLYLFQCSDGLQFSARDRICEFPALAKCDLNNLPTYPTGPTQGHDVTNPTTSTPVRPTPNYYCPEVDGATSYIYASPYSCSWYYMCYGGKLYSFQCSDGLEFSATDRICEFPALAKCDLNHLPSYPTGPTQGHDVTNPTTSATVRPPPNYYCPEVDGATSYIYASPYSCSSYYMCYGGKLYSFQCSEGLEFSATDRICEFPVLAKCDLNNLPNYPTGPTGAITTTRPTPAITTSTLGPTPDFYCPAGNTSQTYVYPCPYSCSYYYMCVDGLLYLVECSTGLEYSTEYKVCLAPSLAKCDLAHLPSYPTGQAGLTTAASVTTDIVPVPSYYCPEVDTAATYRYPNPYSCSSYYQCIKSKLHLYQCPDGFEYSVAEKGCDYTNVAKCDLSHLPSFPAGPTPEVLTTVPNPPTTTYPTVPPPTRTTSGSGDATITVTYECPPNESNVYHRVPGDCHKFYECNHGVAEVQSCAADLLFSESKQDCLYPGLVPECLTSATTAAN